MCLCNQVINNIFEPSTCTDYVCTTLKSPKNQTKTNGVKEITQRQNV